MAVVMPPRKGAMILKKPVMLKDYLLDDLNSCSSSGFKSFPRRQCCTTVRFLLEIDLKTNHNNNNLKSTTPKQLFLRRSRSKDAAANTLSALQRASGAVINAVRSLQFHSGKSSSPALKGGLVLLLPRSISRRLWKKSLITNKVEEDKDVGRWRSFRELLQGRDEFEPSDQTTVSSNSTNKTNSESWGEIEFSNLSSERSNSVGNYAAAGKKVSGGVGATAAGEKAIETSTTATAATSTSCCSPQPAKVWMNKDEEKEQFSPVSVLDCPFEDEDDQSSCNSSPFRSRLALIEDTHHKFMPKIRRFENLTQLEPINLERRMAMSDTHDEEERGNKIDAKAEEVARQLMIIETSHSTLSSDLARMKSEKLVVDLFFDKSAKQGEENVTMDEVLKVAEEWLNGEKHMLSSWEVENGRQIYVSDMDNKYCGKWMKLDEQEEEVGLEMEVEVWNSLLNEFVLDLVNYLDSFQYQVDLVVNY